MLEQSGMPGAAVTVVHDDEVVYAEGFGVRDIDSGEPVDAAMVFQLASLSKPISATMVSALVGRSELDWDDPVTRYNPEAVAAAAAAGGTWEEITDAVLFEPAGMDHTTDSFDEFDVHRVVHRVVLCPVGGAQRHPQGTEHLVSI